MMDGDRSGSELDVLLSHVNASAIAAVCLRIASLDRETLMEIGPGRRFVGVDDRALGKAGADGGSDRRDRICRTFPDHHNNPALALLVPANGRRDGILLIG
jgi:hypothetical protein